MRTGEGCPLTERELVLRFPELALLAAVRVEVEAVRTLSELILEEKRASHQRIHEEMRRKEERLRVLEASESRARGAKGLFWGLVTLLGLAAAWLGLTAKGKP